VICCHGFAVTLTTNASGFSQNSLFKSFVGPLCAYGGLERPNRAALQTYPPAT